MAVVLVVPSQSASAAVVVGGVPVNPAEARMFKLVNAARVRAGVPQLRLAPGYTDVARRWSRGMASRRLLGHNPRLAAAVSVAGGATWRAIGENVAYGYNADVIFGLYMKSPGHRTNILSRSYRYVGVGWVETSSRRGYTTLDFSSSYSSTYGKPRVAPAVCHAH